MLCSDSRVLRAVSVSSTRMMNLPFFWRASSQLKSAVRAPPTCSEPVGDGAKRTRVSPVAGSGTSDIATRDPRADSAARRSGVRGTRPTMELAGSVEAARSMGARVASVAARAPSARLIAHDGDGHASD